jgi:hypothetical protein
VEFCGELNNYEYYIDLVKVKRMYRTPDEDMQYQRDDWDPIEHFSPENIEYLDKLHCDEEKQIKEKKKKIGRNDPCPCGSGLKYKKCCLRKDSLKNHSEVRSTTIVAVSLFGYFRGL